FAAPLPAASASALYRVAEEALRNINQHSQASRAKVTLADSDDAIMLEIADNGRGVDVTRQDPLQAGLGLFSARAVLALVGGELQLSGAPGRGTQVRARIPYKSTGKGPWRPTS
ncbi:MAG TPA: ATP-binding protein, partial [Gemmatimonadaceae bacterium]